MALLKVFQMLAIISMFYISVDFIVSMLNVGACNAIPAGLVFDRYGSKATLIIGKYHVSSCFVFL